MDAYHNTIKGVLAKSDKSIDLQIAEEQYLEELKAIPGAGPAAFERLTKDRPRSALIMKTEQILILSQIAIRPQRITAENIGYQDLYTDLVDIAKSTKRTTRTHLELLENPTLFSPTEQERVLQSIIQQYQKWEAVYEATKQVFTSLINEDSVARVLERIRESRKAAQETLEELLHQELPTAVPSAPRIHNKRIFHTKRGYSLVRKFPAITQTNHAL